MNPSDERGECTLKEDTQMIRGKGRFVNRPGYSKNTKYPTYFIYVPVEVAHDTAFPFKEGDEIEIIIDIDGKHLIVKKPSLP